MKHLAFAIAFGCALSVACWDTPAPSRPTAELSAHQRACQAKGEVLIERYFGEPCAATAMRLEVLVATDADCRAYYGDAGITVDLCAKPDGGAE